MILHIVNYGMENIWNKIKNPFNGEFATGMAIVWAFIVLLATFEVAELSNLLGFIVFFGLTYVYGLLRGVNAYTLVRDYIKENFGKKK